MRCEESSREYMRYEETWAVETARIENYLLKREGAETAGGGIYRCKSCMVKLMPLPPRTLGPVEIPRTRVEISGKAEEAEALHRRFFLQFISAGG